MHHCPEIELKKHLFFFLQEYSALDWLPIPGSIILIMIGIGIQLLVRVGLLIAKVSSKFNCLVGELTNYISKIYFREQF